MRTFKIGFFLLIFGSCALTFGGTKEEIIRLQSDVLQLQNQIRMLQKAVDEKDGMIISLLEQLNDQAAKNRLSLESVGQTLKIQQSDQGSTVSRLREDIQALSLKLDETNNRIGSLHQKMEESQQRVLSLRSVPVAEAGAVVEPDRVYSASYNDYLMGNYELAVAGFQDFLANYPDNELADNAAYYLGDSYLKQGRQELAVQAFDQVINLYPKGDKLPVAYYKKGVALESLQKMSEAIEVFKKLKSLYPDSPEAELADEELQKLGLQ